MLSQAYGHLDELTAVMLFGIGFALLLLDKNLMKKIIGFSMGEMAGRDTFDVHFEKADIDINGAYPMVCRELTRMVMQNHPELLYMNREDDMGLESMRTSKLSYKPEFMVRKFTARMRDE